MWQGFSRYYERRGLLPEPARTESGYRLYSKDDVKRIKFIKQAQGLGFTLNEIMELLSLRVNPEMNCAEVKERTRKKIQEVDQKIKLLEEMKRALVMLETQCSGLGPTSQCPILQGIEGLE